MMGNNQDLGLKVVIKKSGTSRSGHYKGIFKIEEKYYEINDEQVKVKEIIDNEIKEEDT